jgi:putative addiction module component (TIGR02574 family)
MNRDIDISHLSPAECILLAEQLWEKARAHSEAAPITVAQQEELGRRLDALERGELPPAETWDDIQAQLRPR